jgi:hypothetical protein
MKIMPKKKTSASDQVALLAGIERYWKGYLLQLAGKVVPGTAGCVVILLLKYQLNCFSGAR